MSAQNVVTIGGDYWSAQHETFDKLEDGDYDLVILRTGYGGGKTVLGSDWILTTAAEIPNGHSLVLAPDKTKGGPATYKGFFERLPGENTVPNDADGSPENSPIVAGYHGTKNRLTLLNGHVIQLGGADIWSRFAGTEFNAIWCDEVSHYVNTDLYNLHEMLVTRQRTAEGPNVTLWTSTGNGFNQFYDISERMVDENEDPLPWKDRMAVVVGSTLDNPFHEERDKMQAQFEGTERAEQALYGGFAEAKGLVYEDFKRRTHVKEPYEYELKNDRRMYGYDYGHSDPRVLLVGAETVQGQYAIIDMYYKPGQPVEDLVGKWHDGELIAPGWIQTQYVNPGTVYCDHDPEHIEKFEEAGFTAEKANKKLDEGIDEVKSVIRLDDGMPGLIVDQKCTELIKEFQSYKSEHVGKGKAEDHALDALRYLIMGDRYVESDDEESWLITR